MRFLVTIIGTLLVNVSFSFAQSATTNFVILGPKINVNSFKPSLSDCITKQVRQQYQLDFVSLAVEKDATAQSMLDASAAKSTKLPIYLVAKIKDASGSVTSTLFAIELNATSPWNIVASSNRMLIIADGLNGDAVFGTPSQSPAVKN